MDLIINNNIIAPPSQHPITIMFTQNTKMGKLWQELPRSNINKVSINGNLDQWMRLLWNESLKSPQYTKKYKCLCCFPVVGTFLARTEIRQRFASSPWRNPWFQTDMTDHAGSEDLKQKYILECFICLTKFCGAKCQVYCISKPLHRYKDEFIKWDGYKVF